MMLTDKQVEALEPLQTLIFYVPGYDAALVFVTKNPARNQPIVSGLDIKVSISLKTAKANQYQWISRKHLHVYTKAFLDKVKIDQGEQNEFL